MIEEVVDDELSGTEEVDAIGLFDVEDLRASQDALTLSAYSQVRGR